MWTIQFLVVTLLGPPIFEPDLQNERSFRNRAKDKQIRDYRNHLNTPLGEIDSFREGFALVDIWILGFDEDFLELVELVTVE